MILKKISNVVEQDVVKATLCDKLDLKTKEIESKELKMGVLVNKVQYNTDRQNIISKTSSLVENQI